MKRVHVIGAGLIGQERFKAVARLLARGHDVALGLVHDPLHPGLEALARQYGFKPEPDLARFLAQPADLVVVACPHDVAVDLAVRALAAGHGVLLEKPMGRNAEETGRLAAAVRPGRPFFLGLNYRFMPGIAALRSDWAAGRFGRPISLRLAIGHGGKPGDEKTWKLDPVRCGGGALLDPGIHLLDLCRQFLPESAVAGGAAWRGFWKTGIEEDVRLLLRAGEVNVSLETSVVSWRSHFEILALGADGYGHVTGRGRSYGPQIYRRGRRWGWQNAANQAASEERVIEDPCEDSFADELAACLGLPSPTEARPAGLADAVAAMELYQAARAHLD